MTKNQPGCCWMCGAPADSGEQIFLARDLKRFFDEDGHALEALPFHFSVGGHRRIPGPKSDRMVCGAAVPLRDKPNGPG
jgi:hypothetical protein